jgi:hypothetical protein
MKLRVYVDTTVISAVEDARAVDRQRQTIEFFDRVSEFELATAELTRMEILQTPDPARRNKLIARLNVVSVFAIDGAMRQLADDYVDAAIIPAAYRDDAVHIAAAVLARQEVLVSWNFRHMVNRRRRAQVNLLNASRGLQSIEILTPPEL